MFSSRNNDDLSPVTAELFKALSASSVEQIQGLQQTRDIQINLSALLQNEAQRLEKKYGAAHPRVSQLNSRAQRNSDLIQDLEVELEIVSIRQPEADTQSALIEGRVTDENKRGLTGLVVYLGNEQGQPLSFLNKADTDLSGYYALTVTPENLKRIRESEPNGVFLGVCTRQGKQVYQQPMPNQLEAGDRITLEVTLSRADLSPIGGGKPTSPPPSRHDWTVQGRITHANGAAVPGVQVNAIDLNRRFDDKLGTAITAENGTFSITYRFGNAHENRNEQRGPDLYITVISEKGEQLYSSQRNIRQNASRTESFKIILGAIDDPDSPDRPDNPNSPDNPNNPNRPDMPLEGSVIWFETRSTRLRQDGQFAGQRLIKLAIRRIQRFVQTNQNAQIALRGYASVEEGTRSEALSLSEKRAEAVRQQLVESGIPANRLTTTANGISTTYPEVNLNQRVEIVIP